MNHKTKLPKRLRSHINNQGKRVFDFDNIEVDSAQPRKGLTVDMINATKPREDDNDQDGTDIRPA